MCGSEASLDLVELSKTRSVRVYPQRIVDWSFTTAVVPITTNRILRIAQPQPCKKPMRISAIILILTGPAFGGALATGTPSVRVEREFPLRGKLAHAKELSGVTFWGDLAIVCTDEGAELNLLDADTYRLVDKVSLLDNPKDEVDMEGAASDSQYVYVVGSHSLHRKTPDDDAKRKNRKRPPQAKPHEDSYSLFRLTLDDRGQIDGSDRISLAEILAADETLGPFTQIPGKENGVDVEGIAVKRGMLHVGFRGPVLRGNLTPVLSFEFDDPANYAVTLLPLEGRGIRDLTAVEDGFLILTGPMGEEDGEYMLYHWRGDAFASPGAAADDRLTLLGDVDAKGDAKPEGIAPVAETADQWRLLLLCDGDSSGRELVVPRPHLSTQPENADSAAPASP
jgi:hypothetical protein